MNDFQDRRPAPGPLNMGFRESGIVTFEMCVRDSHGRYLATLLVTMRGGRIVKDEPLAVSVPDVFEQRIER